MQLYVLDRAKNTLATTSSFYSDKHHKELTAGASTFEFTIDKSDSAAQYMTTGNYLVFLDDRGRAWSFTILSYDETQTTKTVAAEDVSIELLNKAMDVWNTDQAYPFSYYFDLVTKGTPWTLGVNQLTDLSRKLVYTGRDTGLGRLLSILKGFDNAECQFNIKVQQNKPVEFVVDVYKSIGTVQDNIQIVYNNELNDIKKTESRAQFVTALAGVGGLVENQATTDPGLEKHIDFADINYKDDNFVSPKGDKFIRAVTANKTFNPGTTTYIEDFYDYDTQSAQELLNRTLTQLKERSEPQYTYDADVKVIDPTLDIGDTVTIIDHDYNPALYLQARVATLDKSYTDPTQGAITFCNYRVLNSNLSDQLRAMQNIIDKLPTSSSIKVINNNIMQMITQNEELKKQVALSFESANGKSRVWFSKSATAQDGDIAFIKNADGATEIWKFVEGAWKLDTGLATFDDVKKAASAAADAGSQATIAGQQASAAGADAKSAGDFAASAASQSTIETAAAQSAANSAVDQANLAVSQAGFANNTADQAKTAAANALERAVTAFEHADSINESLTTEIDGVNNSLNLKANKTDVNRISGTINELQADIKLQAGEISSKVSQNDVEGMLSGYATQTWTQSQVKQTADSLTSTIDNLQIGGRNYISNSDKTITINGDTNHYKIVYYNLTPGTWTFSANAKYTRGSDTAIAVRIYNAGHKTWVSTTKPEIVNGRIETTFNVTSDAGKELLIYAAKGTYFDTPGNTIEIDHYKLEHGNKATDWSPAPEDVSSQITQLKDDINLRVKTGDLVSQINVSSEGILIDGRKVHITGDTTIDTGVIKTAMIADAAITNGKIANAAIDNAKIANASITAAKIADLAVGSAQIADGAISSAKIGNAAITSAKIADASILDAKIVSLDGSKIVAHSITADQLDVNAIAVGLNQYGSGWKITPASIGFLPSASSTKASLTLTGQGIILGDTTNGETLGEITGSPYDLKTHTWFNGFNTILKYKGADYWAVLSEESDGTTRPRLMYSRDRLADIGVFQGWTFDDNTHFATIGPMDPSAHAQMRVIRGKVADRWATGFTNAPDGIARHRGGWFITDDGALYLGRANKWYNLFDIVKKIGIA